jgi:hypothetical protein
LVTPAHGFDVTLAWDPNTEPDIVGYFLYSRHDLSSPYQQIEYFPLEKIDPDNPQHTVKDMEGGITYNFVVTAINSAGLESRFSNQITILNGQAILPLSTSSGSGGGGGCFLSTSYTQLQSR